DSDRFLFIKGRKKDIIVTSAGLNIYPEDIELALNHIAGVREASVVEWKGTIHAVLLLEPDVDPRRIVQQANQELEPSQHIQGFTVWPYEDFPRTTTLKPKKRELLDYLRCAEVGEELPSPPVGRMTRLHRLIARVSPEGARAIRPDATLGLDLKLGSIDRLELVSLIEQELGVTLPDELVTAETTVERLESMIAEHPVQVRRLSFPRWSVSPTAEAVRDLAQRLLLFPLLRSLMRLSVEGMGNLNLVSGPVIFASNHQSYLDAPAIVMALPGAWRRTMAVAAWSEYFEASDKPWPTRIVRRLLYYIAVALVNIFPLPRERVFRESIKYAGELIDRGRSILIFPEGHRTTTGKMLPFREGIGLFVSVLRVPVIPVGILGLFAIYSPSKVLPTSGDVRVRFGEPLYFRDESYLEITRRIESAVKDLSKGNRS
ncbi:MAG: 1-acyl-sn-glycerol-3-phosphate acyltransferase, partial [Chloroflexi bacterium]|nr:1-acyl-sn-glycerol-3-phosphate acyltransferase [Chloroflexota bacterium]